MTTINRLTNKATLADNDLIPIWDGDASRTRSVNADSLAKYVSSEIDAGIYVKSGAILNRVLTLTYSNGQSITIEGFDPDGIVITDGVNSFDGVTSIEVGDNLDLTENPDGSLKITAESGGLGGFEIEMTTGLYEYYAIHNLNRYMHAGAMATTDGVVRSVGVQNVDELGDKSRNTCRIYSSEMMFGTLNVI